MLSDCNWVNKAQLKAFSQCYLILFHLLLSCCCGLHVCVLHMIIMPTYSPLFYCVNCDMDHEVSKIEQLALFLVFTGVAGDNNSQLFTCCEHSVLDDLREHQCHNQPVGTRAYSAELLYFRTFLDKQVSCNILNCTHN